MNTTTIIKVENLNKSFEITSGQVQVLKGIDLEIAEGAFTVIYGPSGCGKSTLLHTILGLETPTRGKVFVFGKDIYTEYTEDTLAQLRKTSIGMVYQQPNWVKALNVEENVALPLTLLGIDKVTRMKRAKEELQSVHMLEWASYHPSELSSGQQQKVSLARALITDPRIIIADEPTGNLDFEAGEELIGMLKDFSRKTNKTVLMVTHDLEYLKHADSAVQMFDGKIEKVFSPESNPKEMVQNNIKRKEYEDFLK